MATFKALKKENIQKNPFLLWVDTVTKTPPWPIDWAQWELAHRVLLSRLRQHLKKLGEPGAVWSYYEQWSLDYFRLSSLRAWGGFAMEMSDPMLSIPEWENMATAHERFALTLKNTAAYQTLSRWCKPSYKGISPDEKSRVLADIDGWFGSATVKDKKIEKLWKELEDLVSIRQKSCATSKHIDNGFLVTEESLLKDLPAPHVKSAREMAEKHKKEGWLFKRGTGEIVSACALISSEFVRSQMWEHENQVGINVHKGYKKSVEKILLARQELAQQYNCSSYAAFEMSDRAEPSVIKMERFLRHGLTKMSRISIKMNKKLYDFGIKHLNVDYQLPWNFEFVRHHFNEHYNFSKKVRHLFPFEQTLEKIITDIVKFGGWSVMKKKTHRHPSLVVEWVLQHQNGRVGYLWTKINQDYSNEGAQALAVRSGWGTGPTMAPIAALNFALDDRFDGMSLQDIETVTHELGHALHYLSTSPNTPENGEVAFPWDMVELPSTLVEQTTKDPKCLRRWASAVKPLSFWEEVAAQEPLNILDTQEIWFQAWMDLRLHRMKNIPENLIDFVNKERENFGMVPYIAEDNSVYRYSFFESYSAGFYAYPWSSALAETLVSGSQKDVKKIAEKTWELQEQVLRRVGVMDLPTVWNHWKKESVWDSASNGLEILIKNWKADLARVESISKEKMEIKKSTIKLAAG